MIGVGGSEAPFASSPHGSPPSSERTFWMTGGSAKGSPAKVPLRRGRARRDKTAVTWHLDAPHRREAGL